MSEWVEVEAVPSYCDRIAALDLLARYSNPNSVHLGRHELTLREDIARELGLTLEEVRAQCCAARIPRGHLTPSMIRRVSLKRLIHIADGTKLRVADVDDNFKAWQLA
jgi:hypothetical protein